MKKNGDLDERGKGGTARKETRLGSYVLEETRQAGGRKAHLYGGKASRGAKEGKKEGRDHGNWGLSAEEKAN